MCESLDFFAYKDKYILTYSNKELVDEVYVKTYNHPDMSDWFIYTLPNYGYLLSYENVKGNAITVGTLAGKHTTKNLTLSGVRPPIRDGTFVDDNAYYEIKNNGNYSWKFFSGKGEPIIPANLNNLNDRNTNIENLLFVKYVLKTQERHGLIIEYKDKEYTISDGYILAWFDDRYIVEHTFKTGKTIIYDLSLPYDKRENILYNTTISAKVINIIDDKELGIDGDFNTHFEHVNKDTSIDIYYVSDTKISILHFTAEILLGDDTRREIEVIEYNIKDILDKNKIDNKDLILEDITADDYGFAFKLNNDDWYYINKDGNCFSYLGNFMLLDISHERYERNKEIIGFKFTSESDLNPNLKKLISGYD